MRNCLFLLNLLLLLVLLSYTKGLEQYNISVLAGGSIGDGGPALQARFYSDDTLQHSVTTKSNELYFVMGCRIRKILSNGIVDTILGDGICENSGDGDLASRARTGIVKGMVLDPTSQDLIFTSGHKIRRISQQTGIISTMAGSDQYGYEGDGGLALYSKLYNPQGLSISKGETYIADKSNSAIRKISKDGIISTVIGTRGFIKGQFYVNTTTLDSPYAIAVNPAEQKEICFLEFYWYNRAKKTLTNGTIVIVKEITITSINYDPKGVLYIGGGSYLTSLTGFGSTIRSNSLYLTSENEPVSNTFIWDPSGFSFDSVTGELIFICKGTNRIRKVTNNRIVSTILGAGDVKYQGIATGAQLHTPTGLAVGPNGEILVAETTSRIIRKISENGIISTVAGAGFYGTVKTDGLATDTLFSELEHIAVDPVSGDLFITDKRGATIRKVTNGMISTFAGSTRGFGGDGGLATLAKLDPSGVAVDPTTRAVIIADSSNCRIRKVKDGIISTIAGSSECGYNDGSALEGVSLSSSLKGLTVSKTGDIYFIDSDKIRKLSSSGIVSTIAGNGYESDGTSAINAMVKSPKFITIHPLTDDLYFVEPSPYNRIRIISKETVISTLQFGGNVTTFKNLYGIAISTKGQIYVSDQSNNLIGSISPICTKVNCVHGVCSLPDVCACDPGYKGEDCSTFTCEQPCIGGICSGPNTCACYFGYVGSNCSLPSSPDAVAAIIIPFVTVFIGLISTAIIITVIIWIYFRKKKKDLIPKEIHTEMNQKLLSYEHASSIVHIFEDNEQFDPLEKYEILERIGQGAFGSVYKAKLKENGSIRALKSLKYDTIEDLNLALREGIQLMNVSHANVLRVNDIFVGKNQLHIDMDYYEKGDLCKLIYRKDVQVSEKIILDVLKQSISALHFVHTTLKTIHRDVKPSNIFIRSLEGDEISIVLADFGLAKPNRDSANSYAGTPLFMSPELGLGSKYSFNTDVYSLGVTAYQLMTKDVATSISHLYLTKDESVVQQTLESNMKQPGVYSQQLIDLVKKMLAKEPQIRPNTEQVIVWLEEM